MFHTLRSAILLAILAIGVHGFTAQAAGDAEPLDAATIAKNHKANEDCFSCHSEAGLKDPPKPGIDLVKLAATVMVPQVFNDSNHGNMDCRQCHGQSYKDYPHAPNGKTETSPCSECHAGKVLRLEPQFDASVHGKNLKGKMTCGACHDPHIALSAKKLKDPQKIVAQDNKACLNCHNSDLTFAKHAPEDEKTPGTKRVRPDIDTIHEWLPNTRLHWKAVRCIECHTPPVAATKLLSHEIQGKDKAEKACVTCHTRNSSLNTRLYRHLRQEDLQKGGFTNAVILESNYVVGATRHPLLDSIVIGLMVITLFGVLAHGLLRIIFSIRRKGQQR